MLKNRTNSLLSYVKNSLHGHPAFSLSSRRWDQTLGLLCVEVKDSPLGAHSFKIAVKRM